MHGGEAASGPNQKILLAVLASNMRIPAKATRASEAQARRTEKESWAMGFPGQAPCTFFFGCFSRICFQVERLFGVPFFQILVWRSDQMSPTSSIISHVRSVINSFTSKSQSPLPTRRRRRRPFSMAHVRAPDKMAWR